MLFLNYEGVSRNRHCIKAVLCGLYTRAISIRMILTAVLAVLFANGAFTEHVWVIGEPGNGEKIPIDISLKDGFVTTVSGQPYPPQPFFRQSINFYDFDKQLEARRVVEEDVCYIRKFTATYAQVKNVVDAAKVAKSKVTTGVTEEWNIPGKEIKGDELEKTVGAEIAEFCSGYKVFWLKGNKEITKSQVVRMVKRQLSGFGKLGHNQKGLFAKAGLKYNNGKGLTGVGGLNWDQGAGLSANGKLSFDNGRGFKTNIGAGYSKTGPSFKSGLEYNNGRGFSVTGGAGYSRQRGAFGTVGLRLRFP